MKQCVLSTVKSWHERVDHNKPLQRKPQAQHSTHLLAHSSTRAGRSVLSLACLRATAARFRRIYVSRPIASTTPGRWTWDTHSRDGHTRSAPRSQFVTGATFCWLRIMLLFHHMFKGCPGLDTPCWTHHKTRRKQPLPLVDVPPAFNRQGEWVCMNTPHVRHARTPTDKQQTPQPTLTATSALLLASRPRYTCPSDAAATGQGLREEKTSVQGRPSSSSMTCRV